MSKIKITADSTNDLSPKLQERFGVEIIPLYVQMGGESYRDGVDAYKDDIFRYVEASGSLPTTSAVAMQDYLDTFRRLTADGSEVIHVNISAELSASHQNARLAAEEIPGVHVVDSRNLSSGSALLTLTAAELAAEGKPAAEIAGILREAASRVEASFVVDTLAYLHKGGRCSSVAALGANLLKLKPCIEVKNGGMSVGKKYRGALIKCLREYVEDRLSGREDIDLHRIFVTSTARDPALPQEIAGQVRELQAFDEVLIEEAGCTISSHCGPDCLGILFMRK